ncbi:hypothetical protein TSOC_011826 [Tetrabaena socialis]|uniref:Uncharacterized protein n=1 Tax=Tetrabaena socialis TaxID=47790 RepID=A0A2J7ZPL6_9CHLO|nr:hypothetical protein TSOC_011826 [Tetrabaena socialis]|eukprot:PNH02209.1 hypothetical protein TSOC_011826 [Tetrabaena socialis]
MGQWQAGSRPASWSKIPAVLSVLESYDWVFWMDADTLVTNTTAPLEALLPPAGGGGGGVAAPDLILTRDSTGVNAGVWLMRGRDCAWCRGFLDRWWGLDSFVRAPGDTKSGDNDALKHMISTMGRGGATGCAGLSMGGTSGLGEPGVDLYFESSVCPPTPPGARGVAARTFLAPSAFREVRICCAFSFPAVASSGASDLVADCGLGSERD